MNALDTLSALDLIQGAIRVEEMADGLMPWRVTPGQYEHLASLRENWGTRARCSAGMLLGLRTSSRQVTLDLHLLPGCRRSLALDVDVDGQVHCAYRADAVDDGPLRLTVLDLLPEAPDREREVRVYLPPSRWVLLRAVALEAGASVAALARPPRRLLTVGDSITQGMDAAGGLETYAQQLAILQDAELLNLGIGGHVFDPDYVDPALGYDPDRITVAYGTNDWNGQEDSATTAARADAMLRGLAAQYPRARLYVLTPIWRVIGHELRLGLDLATFSQTIRAVAEAIPGVQVIDGRELVPHDRLYMPDGTHPNSLGFLHYASRLHRRLGP